MATIIDIAKEAGVSFKTVSRVLNDESNVRPATREKVLIAAARLQYKKNTAARNLRSKRPKTIALLLNNPSQSYSQSVQLGALLGCQQHGLYLSLQENSDVNTLDALIRNEEILGFILAPPISHQTSIIRRLRHSDKYIIRLGADDANAGGIRMTIDDKKAAFDLTEYLIELGHANIGFIKGHVDYQASEHRYQGFKNALEKHGLTLHQEAVVQGDFSYASGLKAAETILSRPKRPSAIFASNDDMAAGALAAAYKKNIRAPDMLSLVGFDDSPITTAVYPKLTTIRQSLSDMVTKAVEILVSPDKIARDTKIIFDHSLISRDSSRPPP